MIKEINFPVGNISNFPPPTFFLHSFPSFYKEEEDKKSTVRILLVLVFIWVNWDKSIKPRLNFAL